MYWVAWKTSSIKYTPTKVPPKKKKFLYSKQWSHALLCLLLCSGGGEGSLDRLLPPVSTGLSPRKRTTSQCKSEPPLLRTSKRTIYTAGRPPWYNEHGTQSKEAFVIGRTFKEMHATMSQQWSFLSFSTFSHKFAMMYIRIRMHKHTEYIAHSTSTQWMSINIQNAYV